MVGDGLERRNELLDVVLPSRVLRKGQRPDALIGEELRPGKNDLPHLARRRVGIWIDERGVAEQRSDAVAERREASIEGRFEASHDINADDRLLASLAFRARPFHHQLAHGFAPDDAQRLLYLGQRALRLLGRSSHIGQAGHCTPELSQRFLRGMRDIARRLLDRPNPPIIGGRIRRVLRIEPDTQPLALLLIQPTLGLDAGADLFDLGRRQEAIGPRDVQKRQDGRDARRIRGPVLDGGGCFGHELARGRCRAITRDNPVIRSARMGLRPGPKV